MSHPAVEDLPFLRVLGDMMYSTVGNSLLNFALRFILSKCCGKNVAAIKPSRRNRAILYIISAINAAAGVAYGAHHYLTGGATAATRDVLETRAYGIVCYVTGYFIYDLFFVLPEARKYPVDLFHHGLGAVLGIAAAVNIGSVYQLVPAFSIQEFSTLPLNLMWFTREFEAFSKRFDQLTLKKVFAMSFFALRVVNLPLQYFLLCQSGAFMKASNAVHYSLLAFIGLQYYWFYGIVAKARAALKEPKAKAVAEGKTKDA